MFYEQLKKACKMRKTSVTAVLKQIGIGTANGTYWKNGSVPSSDIVVKLAELLNVSTDYLLLGKEITYSSSNIHIDEPKQVEASSSSPKFVNKATYNGTVNEVTGNYAHQNNYIGIQESDLLNKSTTNDVVVELDDLIRSLDDDSIKEMLITQVRASIESVRKLSESYKKKKKKLTRQITEKIQI